eukprot:12637160-Alexandrium_andersonii.AAC.1
MIQSGPARDDRPPLHAAGRPRQARRRGEVREVLVTAQVRCLRIHLDDASYRGRLRRATGERHAASPPGSRA